MAKHAALNSRKKEVSFWPLLCRGTTPIEPAAARRRATSRQDLSPYYIGDAVAMSRLVAFVYRRLEAQLLSPAPM